MAYLEQLRKVIPPLNGKLHKGQAGKIGVIGGSREYTGAPYYAGYSALKVGADISHIFCDNSAGTAIKSYSPELIVHPVLKTSHDLAKKEEHEQIAQQVVDSVSKWFSSLHVIIVGPGLGRDNFTMDCTKRLINKAKEAKLPILIDGDGLYLLSTDPSIIKGYQLAVLTPNVMEFGRLCEATKIDPKGEKPLEKLCDYFGNVTIVRKGASDIISNGKETIECSEEGSPRRCGGQGDFLAGSLGVFMGWATQLSNREDSKDVKLDTPPLMLASYGACFLSRHASRTAFQKHLRSTTTPNMIEEIGPVFEKYFPSTAKL